MSRPYQEKSFLKRARCAQLNLWRGCLRQELVVKHLLDGWPFLRLLGKSSEQEALRFLAQAGVVFEVFSYVPLLDSRCQPARVAGFEYCNLPIEPGMQDSSNSGLQESGIASFQ